MRDIVFLGVLTALWLIPVSVIWLSDRHYKHLLLLPQADRQDRAMPRVDIIVPARNEADVIARVVSSLLALDYPSAHLTVVDDSSDDDTGAIASKLGASVLHLEGNPPAGWTGKCNACQQAAQHSTAEWLLFTDADTYHEPNSLCSAIVYAEQNQLDGLSLLLDQECETFWEKLVLPMAYQNYFATLSTDQPAFNGQYILIRREIYERSGGFGAVRGRVMEDVALAELLATHGYKIALLNGHDAASVRMYRSLSALIRGMTKTAYAAAHDRGGSGVLLGLTFMVCSLAIPAVIVGLLTPALILMMWGMLMMATTAIGLVKWMRRFGVHPAWLYSTLSPVGVILMLWIGFTSTVRNIFGRGVRWKDRTIIEQRHVNSQP